MLVFIETQHVLYFDFFLLEGSDEGYSFRTISNHWDTWCLHVYFSSSLFGYLRWLSIPLNPWVHYKFLPLESFNFPYCKELQNTRNCSCKAKYSKTNINQRFPYTLAFVSLRGRLWNASGTSSDSWFAENIMTLLRYLPPYSQLFFCIIVESEGLERTLKII